MKKMKYLSCLLLAVVSLASVGASADSNVSAKERDSKARDYRDGDRHDRDHRDRNWRNRRDRRDRGWDRDWGRDRHRRGRHHNDGVCAPEVAQSNLNKVETVLNETARRPDFADALLYKEAIAAIQKNPSIDDRIDGYMEIVGVDNMDQVADLLGGEHTAYYVEYARDSLELSREQAEVLVNSLTTALRGKLK